MNIGKIILDLRRQKNITQEGLASELGVTAAAVSKWENGYTLPDILMLCALADFFQVSTDELLGRKTNVKYAVIAAYQPQLAQQIAELIKRYGFIAKHIYRSYDEALETCNADPCITHLFSSFEKPMNEDERGDRKSGLYCVESHAETTEKVLDGFEIYLQNMSNYDALMLKNDGKP